MWSAFGSHPRRFWSVHSGRNDPTRLDPADTHRALSSQAATIVRHEQSIQIAHQNLAALAQCVDTLVPQMKLLTSSAAFAHPVAGAAAALTVPGDLYACDAEPFDGTLEWCRGFFCFVFLRQCLLVFDQHLHLFASDEAKINDIIGLLRG